MVPEWIVILSYILFGVGTVMVIIALIRILWYCCVVRRDNKDDKKNFYDNPYYFSAHATDPWLKDNAIVKRRLEDSSDKGSLRDINMGEFIHNHLGESPRALSERLYETLTNEDSERTHIDSQTVQTQAHYEEPNTNLIIAMKEKHVPPENTDVSSYGSDTALVKINGSAADTNGDIIHSSRSAEAREALSALDLATAGEDIAHKSELDTSVEESHTPRTPITPRPNIATANEPLPVDSEMTYVYASTVFVSDQGSTQL